MLGTIEDLQVIQYRRLAVQRVPVDHLLEILKGQLLVVDGIPVDAKVVGVEYDLRANAINLLLEGTGAPFYDVPPAGFVPNINIVTVKKADGVTATPVRPMETSSGENPG